jgi:hypothetical protein
VWWATAAPGLVRFSPRLTCKNAEPKKLIFVICLRVNEAECGRGLTVVAALSDRWGQERTGQRRKVVWAELALCAHSL